MPVSHAQRQPRRPAGSAGGGQFAHKQVADRVSKPPKRAAQRPASIETGNGAILSLEWGEDGRCRFVGAGYPDPAAAANTATHARDRLLGTVYAAAANRWPTRAPNDWWMQNCGSVVDFAKSPLIGNLPPGSCAHEAQILMTFRDDPADSEHARADSRAVRDAAARVIHVARGAGYSGHPLDNPDFLEDLGQFGYLQDVDDIGGEAARWSTDETCEEAEYRSEQSWESGLDCAETVADAIVKLYSPDYRAAYDGALLTVTDDRSGTTRSASFSVAAGCLDMGDVDGDHGTAEEQRSYYCTRVVDNAMDAMDDNISEERSRYPGLSPWQQLPAPPDI